jgi:hypothetical protein
MLLLLSFPVLCCRDSLPASCEYDIRVAYKLLQVFAYPELPPKCAIEDFLKHIPTFLKNLAKMCGLSMATRYVA